MPKKEKIYIKNINVRISGDQYEQWDDYAKKNGFDDISKLVRYATDGLVQGSFTRQSNSKKNELRDQRIHQLEQDNKELLKSQKEILKFVAEKAKPLEQNKSILDYQKKVMINLLQDKPRDEEDLMKMLELSEIKILSLLNDLLQMGVIEQIDEKYKVIENW